MTWMDLFIYVGGFVRLLRGDGSFFRKFSCCKP